MIIQADFLLSTVYRTFFQVFYKDAFKLPETNTYFLILSLTCQANGQELFVRKLKLNSIFE